MYDVSKCFGEATASYFAHAERLSSIVVRIGSYDVNGDPSNWLQQQPNPRHLSDYVSERDLNQLLVRCIEAVRVPFAIVHAISNNRFKRLDLTSTRDLPGYAPRMMPLRSCKLIYQPGYRNNDLLHALLTQVIRAHIDSYDR